MRADLDTGRRTADTALVEASEESREQREQRQRRERAERLRRAVDSIAETRKVVHERLARAEAKRRAS